MMNAAAPMMGGMICPPVDATASTAPAYSGLYPTFFMRGMVNVPVETTLAMGEPLMLPNSALLTTATLAGPPRIVPKAAKARSINA